MKKLMSFSVFVFFTSIIIVACKKDNNNNSTTPLTKEQILTQKSWQVDEVLRNISGSNSRYVRGGINNTGVNYNLLRLTFNADGTGTYVDEVGTSHTATWQFTTPDKYNLQLVVGPPFAQTYMLNLVEITATAFYNTTAVGSNILVSARYVQVL